MACPSREIREIRRCRNVAGSAAGGVGIVTKAPGYPPALPIDHTSVCLVDGQRTRDAAEVQSEKKKRFCYESIVRPPEGRLRCPWLRGDGWNRAQLCSEVLEPAVSQTFACFGVPSGKWSAIVLAVQPAQRSEADSAASRNRKIEKMR